MAHISLDIITMAILSVKKTWKMASGSRVHWCLRSQVVDLARHGVTCPNVIQRGPCMMKQVKTKLLDSRVSYNRVVDHRSRWPVIAPLCSYVNRCHVWQYWLCVCVTLAVCRCGSG